MKKIASFSFILCASFFFTISGWSDIVINEIMYHPRSNDFDEEYLELHNTGVQDVILNQYAFTDGITFTFTMPYTIPANGYVVIARNAGKIKEMYGIENVVGNFIGQLSNSGEMLVLEDNLGRIVDQVDYLDEAPWPVSADGQGPSLELIEPNQNNDNPFNWRSSAEPVSGLPWGTPGRANGTTTSNLPPKITDTRHRPESPKSGEVVSLRADVVDETGVMQVWAEYNAVRIRDLEDDITMPVEENIWHRINLFDDGSHGDRIPFDNSYESELPLFPAGTLIRYKIFAQDFLSQQAVSPTQFEYPEKLGIYIQDAQQDDVITEYIITLDESDRNQLLLNSQLGPEDDDFNDRVRGTFIGLDGIVYEDVEMRFLGERAERLQAKKGWKIYFNDDYEFKQNGELILDALVHVDNPSHRGDAGLYETLAWKVYHRAGVAPVRTDIIQLNVNGENQGVYLEREDVEEDFLRRIGRDPDANLYHSEGTPELRADERILASMDQYMDVYENQTNDDSDFLDLVTLIEKLNVLEGEGLKSYFMNNVDVDRLIAYLAAGALCVDVDHVWHNHYLYHRSEDGLWEIFPEMLDQTFGNAQAGLYMDLSIGGSVDGIWPLAQQLFSIPEFQARYEEKIREIMIQIYKPSRLFPLIDQFVERYEEAAQMDRNRWGNVIPGYQSLQTHADSLKVFIRGRRANLITQLPWDMIITNVQHQPVTPSSLDAIQFTIHTLSSEEFNQVMLHTFVEGDGAIQHTPMQRTAFVKEFIATLSPFEHNDVLHYYFTIQSGDSTLRYPESPMEEFVLHVKDNPEDFYSNVVINEIMYNGNVSENEWIEFYNANDFALDLDGWILKDEEEAHEFVFPEGAIIEAGDYLLATVDTSLLSYIYQVSDGWGNISFNFGNDGDQVRLIDPSGNLIDFVLYDDNSPWPVDPDGEGPSLELIEYDFDNSIANSWSRSTLEFPKGTPGQRNSVSPEPSAIDDWGLY